MLVKVCLLRCKFERCLFLIILGFTARFMGPALSVVRFGWRALGKVLWVIGYVVVYDVNQRGSMLDLLQVLDWTTVVLLVL